MGKRKNVTVVGATEVRAWAAETSHPDLKQPREGESAARGRMSQRLIADYEAATGNRYEAGHRPVQTFEVPVTKFDSKGRKRTRKVVKSRAEVLEAAGLATNHKGVVSKAALEAASVALSDPAPTSA